MALEPGSRDDKERSMKLLYRAVTKDGKAVRGIIEAKDKTEAASYLRRREFIPIQITLESKSILGYLPFLNKTSNADIVFFTRQLSSMLASGLTLMQSLRILKDQVENAALSGVVNGLITDVEEGKSFSSAIEKYPAVFSPIYISLIKAAESSGLLDKVLLRLADNLEKQQKLKSTIKSALMYPAIVITGMFVVTFIMMIFVIPQLTTLYESLNVELPLPTKIIVGMSSFVANFWPLVFAMIGFLLFMFRRWHKTEAGKLIMDDFILKVPVFGKLTRQTILAEFSRTLGLLVGTGSLVVESLNQTSDVAGNIIYKNAIVGVSRRVEKGISVGDAMTAYPIFPSILVQMVKIGEQTGKLDESLLKVSEYFEREVDQTVKTLTAALEPFIMIVLGLGVAFLIISIIMPIYSLTSSIG